MSDKPLIEEIREIMWNPPASHSEKEEITRLRAEVAELQTSVALMNRATGILWRERDELRAQIAAHERECAGVLVKVEERLPVAFRSVQTYHGEGRVCHSNCVDRHGAWYVPEASHWLDARMPGGEE